MRIYGPNLPVVLRIDAARHAVGTIPEQERYPAALESRKLPDRESLSPAYDLELFGVVHALNKWRTMLDSNMTVVETSLATLKHLLSQKKVTPHLGKWLDKLAELA